MASVATMQILPDLSTPLQRISANPSAGAADLAGGDHLSLVHPPIVRSGYEPSRRSGPVAFIASAGVILAAMGLLTTLNIVGKHKAENRLTVVALKELDATPPPPPPPPKSLEKPVEQPPLAFIPKPRIELPSPGPKQVALDLPAPPVSLAVAVPRIEAPAGPAEASAPAASSSPVEGGDLSSQVLSAKPPVYPVEARRHKQQGTVKLLILVGVDGRVADIKIASSSGTPSLDSAALGAVKRWRWAPQMSGGAPVAVRGYVTIPFVLTT